MKWIRAAKITDVEEAKAVRIDLESGPVALFNASGQFYAIDSTCPHKGGPLAEGYLDGLEVTCPWHAWTFNIQTGQCLTLPGVKIRQYPVKVEGHDVFIGV